MKELSEKELELEYKNLKMMDVPDMWADIERNLAPKNPVRSEQKKKAIPIRRISSIAAAVAVVLLLIPAANVVMSGGKAGDAAANQTTESAADISEGMEESAAESVTYPEMESNTSTEEEGVREELAEAETTEDMEYTQGDTEASTESVKNENDSTTGQQTLKIQIRQIQESEEGLIITATVLERIDDSLSEDAKNTEANQVVVITYPYSETGDVETYERADFPDIITVLVERTGENLKLLEILP